MGWYPGKFLKGDLFKQWKVPEDIIDRIYKDIEDEIKAAEEYKELEKILRERGEWKGVPGLAEAADIVKEIRLDEVDHRFKLREMLNKLRREYLPQELRR
jgi:hypothetical protein